MTCDAQQVAIALPIALDPECVDGGMCTGHVAPIAQRISINPTRPLLEISQYTCNKRRTRRRRAKGLGSELGASSRARRCREPNKRQATRTFLPRYDIPTSKNSRTPYREHQGISWML